MLVIRISSFIIKMASADLTEFADVICDSDTIDYDNIYSTDKKVHEIVKAIEQLETGENVDDCPLCMEPYNFTNKEPLILACFHKCCTECFLQLPKDTINKEEYYKCYDETCHYKGKMYKTKTNKIVNEIVNAKLREEMPGLTRICEFCDKEATIHCKDCFENKNLCEDCDKFIHNMKIHEKISIEEYNKNSKYSFMCPTHDSDEITYCYNGNKHNIVYLCNQCIVEPNVNLTTIGVFDKYYDTQKNILLKFICNTFTFIKEINTVIEKCKNITDIILKCQETEMKKIYEHLKILNTSINNPIIQEDCRRSHILRSKIIISLFKSIIDYKLKTIQNYIIEIHKFIEIITSILKLCINPELYYNKHFLIEFTNFIIIHFKHSVLNNYIKIKDDIINIFIPVIVINVKKAFDISNKELSVMENNGLYTIFTEVIVSVINTRSRTSTKPSIDSV